MNFSITEYSTFVTFVTVAFALLPNKIVIFFLNLIATIYGDAFLFKKRKVFLISNGNNVMDRS